MRFSYGHLAVVCAFAMAAPGCAAKPRAGLEPAQAYRIGRTVATIVADRVGVSDTTPEFHLVFVTAEACLSCRDVGYLLRRLAEDGPPGSSLVIATPSSDGEAVRAFLKYERAPGRLELISDDAIPRLAWQSVIYYGLIERRGGLVDSVVADDAAAILSVVRSNRVF